MDFFLLPYLEYENETEKMIAAIIEVHGEESAREDIVQLCH